MKVLWLLPLVAVSSLSNPIVAQQCRLDYGQKDLKELRLSDDYRLAYLEYGSGEPVVLVHGALSDYRDWWLRIEELRRDYRVIAPSRRSAFPNSLSRSPNTPVADMWSDSGDVIELIDRLSVGRVHLIGHSAGGAVALDIAVRRPDLLRSLVLEEPAVREGSPPPEMQRLLASVIEQIGRGETRNAIRDFLNFTSGPGYFDALSAECQQMFTENAATVSIGPRPPTMSCAEAGSVRVPVLYISGEISPMRGSPLEACLPQRASVTISGASHGTHSDNPREFNEAIRAFIAKH